MIQIEKVRGLIVFLFAVLLFTVSTPVFAYSGGLLNGKSLNHSDSFLNKGNPTTKATDGDLATFVSLGQATSATDALWYEIQGTATIDSYQISATGTSIVLYFYGVGDQYLSSVTTVNNGQKQTLSSPVTGVRKVGVGNLATSTTNSVYEFDVFGNIVDSVPPAVPTGLVATAGDGQVTLNWTANTETDLKGYKIYQDSVMIGTVTINSNTVISLVNGREYAFQVSAFDTSGNESGLSETVTATPNALPLPKNVTISQGKVGTTTTEVLFTATDADSIELYRDGVKIATLPGDSTSYEVSGLTPSVTYQYYIRALNENGAVASNIISVKTLAEPPKPPEITSVSVSTTKTQIKVSWVGGVAPYTVKWGAETKETSDTSVLLGGFSPGTVVTITVTDSNGSSKTVTVKTPESGELEDPLLPSETGVFQRMVNLFGTAGTYALVIIGGAVALGIIVILAMYTWRLLKRWLNSAK